MDIKQNYSGMVVKNHYFSVPLDYDNNDSERLDIFAREIRSIKSSNKKRPYLCFFQGGPGYEAPRPITYSGWIKKACEKYTVLLLDQRGTGLSSPITSTMLEGKSDKNIAEYLSFFRADNIVKDAEFIRKQLISENKWSILGQSFGGFCAVHYLSYYPNSLNEVFITGGLPPLNSHVDDIYRATYARVIEKNKVFYTLFPQAKIQASKIAEYLLNNKVKLPNGDHLSCKRFQQLGLSLGFSDGMATLNYLFEAAFCSKKLSYSFLKGIFAHQTFDTNPIFTILHEACYAQAFSSNWSAYRILDEFPEFKFKVGKPLFFTGEMLFPWMMKTYSNLRPFKGAADILAQKDDWPLLYDSQQLSKNKVPVAAVVYTNDMYVDRHLSMETAKIIRNIRIWETREYEHNGLRSNGGVILSNLFKKIR